MKDVFKGLLRKGANAAINTGLARNKLIELLNSSGLARYGAVESLEFDLTARRVHFRLRLLGEPSAIDVEIDGLAITGSSELALRIEALRVDREWLQNLADDHVVGVELPIPSQHIRWAAKLQAVLGTS